MTADFTTKNPVERENVAHQSQKCTERQTNKNPAPGTCENKEKTELSSFLGMIWAQDLTGGIGKDGKMPWHLPADIKFFARTTRGHAVIMGRTTWQSLEPKYRPLPGRKNLVLTRDSAKLEEINAQGGHGCADIEAALAQKTTPFTYVIGGASIYKLFMPRADFCVVTVLKTHFSALDAFAPTLEDWIPGPKSAEFRAPDSSYNYQFTTWLNPRLEANSLSNEQLQQYLTDLVNAI